MRSNFQRLLVTVLMLQATRISVSVEVLYGGTLIPEAIYGGSEERSEGEEKSPLVEFVGSLTSMLSPSTEIEPCR